MPRNNLLEARLSLAEHKRNVWFATVPDDVGPDDLLETNYWSLVAMQMRPFDEIIVTNDDCSWRIWLVVEDAWNVGARVAMLARHDMSKLEQPEAETDMRVRWAGPHRLWAIIRRDGGVVKDKLPSKEVAMQHLTAMANQKVA